MGSVSTVTLSLTVVTLSLTTVTLTSKALPYSNITIPFYLSTGLWLLYSYAFKYPVTISSYSHVRDLFNLHL